MNVDVSYLTFYKVATTGLNIRKEGRRRLKRFSSELTVIFIFLLHKDLNEIAVAAVHLNDLSDHSALGQLDDLCKIDVAEGT